MHDYGVINLQNITPVPERIRTNVHVFKELAGILVGDYHHASSALVRELERGDSNSVEIAGDYSRITWRSSTQ